MSNEQRPTILIVDDDVRVGKALQRAFASLDAHIVTTLSARDALDILRRQRVDLIVSDDMMPGMTGIELLAEARAVAPDCRRVLLTGFVSAGSVKGAVERAGIDCYFTKPWDNDALVRRVRGLLGGASSSDSDDQGTATEERPSANREK